MDKWFCVKFMEGAKTLKKTFKKITEDQTIGHFVKNLSEDQLSHVLINKIDGYLENPDKPTAGKTHEIPMDVPFDMMMSAVSSFGVVYLVIICEAAVQTDAQTDAQTSQKPAINAFELLKTIEKRYDWMPSRNLKNAKDKLFNDIAAMSKEQFNVGFLQRQQDTGKKIIGTIADTVWYLEPFRGKFDARSIKLPDLCLQGYRDHVQQHKKMPILTSVELKQKIDQLAQVLMHPWFLNDKFSAFKKVVSEICDGMQRYYDFLKKQQERTAQNHASATPVRGFNDNWGFERKRSTNTVPGQYKSLQEELQKRDLYTPIFTQQFEPSDAAEARKWRQNIALPFGHVVFTYSFGNYFGNAVSVWRLPENEEECTAEKDMAVIAQIKEALPTFSTRTIRKKFFQTYLNTDSKLKPYQLRSMFFFLSPYEYMAETSKAHEIDTRAVQILLATDDAELVADLRKNNGRVKDPRFDAFWGELQKMLDEHTAVDDRRDGETCYMPFAISVEDLREQVLKRLPPDTPAPSVSWIRLNFMPSNPSTRAAVAYTGRFNVKFAVQQRLLRAQHEDAPYALKQFYMMKDMAVRYRDDAVFLCLDDKAIVPIGEPNSPVSTNVRAHHAGITVVGGSGLLCLDHDYSVAGMVPSVLFKVDLPENSHDSFFNGEVHVTVKDKVFQASSPLRHAAETLHILREIESEDGVNLDKAIMFKFTDGGPDHRTTYKSVQAAIIVEFMALDLDMIVCVRTAPNQSYNNPAERKMSLLNLALQNVALSRTTMTEGFEVQAKRLGSLAALRNHAKRQPEFKPAYMQSTAAPRRLVRERFGRLKHKGGTVKVHEAATAENLEVLKELLQLLDEGVDVENLRPLNTYPALAKFIEGHVRERHYTYQVKKCNEQACTYCSVNPPRLSEEIFSGLSFLPDPVIGPDGDYLSFEELYNVRETSGNDRPALKSKPQPTDADKTHRNLLVAGKVRGFITCHECGKRRVVFCGSKLTLQEERAVFRREEELLYSCGSALFTTDPYKDRIVVREGQNCENTMETAYYAGKTQDFEAACFYCGNTDGEQHADDEVIQQLRTQYGIVRPICRACMDAGKQPCTRNALKVPRI